MVWMRAGGKTEQLIGRFRLAQAPVCHQSDGNNGLRPRLSLSVCLIIPPHPPCCTRIRAHISPSLPLPPSNTLQIHAMPYSAHGQACFPRFLSSLLLPLFAVDGLYTYEGSDAPTIDSGRPYDNTFLNNIISETPVGVKFKNSDGIVVKSEKTRTVRSFVVDGMAWHGMTAEVL